MKTKFKTLKTNIDKNFFYLQQRYPMTRVISEALDIFSSMDVDDEAIALWYESQKHFIRDLEEEIIKLDDEAYIYERIKEFKLFIDSHYKDLEKKYDEFFLSVYKLITFLLEKDISKNLLKESYKNIYGSIKLILEETF